MGKTMAREVIHKVCLVIWDVLANNFFHLINLQVVVTGFHCKSFSNCVGVMDSIHIPLLCLAHAPQVVISCKDYFSIVLQSAVNHQGHFTKTFGCVGSAHDAYVFCNSLLLGGMESGCYALRVSKFIIGNVNIPILIRDLAYLHLH
ncbi:hypothetical protein Y1Q_0000511 [Alligator mississippiensis]|uniref:DDE Tnp4 domain-containing protein n=1 Tax=Alligator mississippiensis TaxID=8496 RepID=A0A151MBD5_ALLMI|nr:hypothetical protein Y1Q_0000511 [Alligator mississippiensis]